jgi:hypothetical protein
MTQKIEQIFYSLAIVTNRKLNDAKSLKEEAQS